LVPYANVRIKTFVRIQTADSELFFLHTTLLPDDLRIQLSRRPGCSGDRRDHRRLGGCLRR